MLTFVFVLIANAQVSPPPPLGEEQPVFPIDDFTFLALIVAVILGYCLTARRIKKENL